MKSTDIANHLKTLRERDVCTDFLNLGNDAYYLERCRYIFDGIMKQGLTSAL